MQTSVFFIRKCKLAYSCFDKGCPNKRKRVRDNAERQSWKYPINFNKSSESIMPRPYSEDLAGNMDSELSLKFIGYFPDYLSALSGTLLPFLWTTFVETAVFKKMRGLYQNKVNSSLASTQRPGH